MTRLEETLLSESGLSRLFQHMQEHECGTITAFRKWKVPPVPSEDAGGKKMGSDNPGTPYTWAENMKKNHVLKAQLQSARFGVTNIKGTYIENYGKSNAVEVDEETFFVVDLNNSGNLRKVLTGLGTHWDQDSILHIPLGGESAELVGTNRTGYPGYGQTIHFNKRQWGSSGEFFSKVRGRPWMFSSSGIKESNLPEGFFGRWGCFEVSKMDWQKIPDSVIA